ncbi:MAG: putative sulfate exporter family transporter [Porphyromonadaceae bacterium]|nr:putative sulfate exporter family transporter [Porphyromonadaceae bacterium]
MKFKGIAFTVVAFATIFTTPAVGLLAGIVFALVFGNPFPKESKKISKYLLQLSVVGLGFGMNLHEALQSGREGMMFTIVSVAAVLVIGWFLGLWLKLPKTSTYLISSGTAICGGSAIAAVAPLTKSSDSEISVSIATIFILNTLALFIFPPLGLLLGLDDIQFGTWAAIAIHDTSSVVGAGEIYSNYAGHSNLALQTATTVKLTRALWIIPLTFVTMFIFKDKKSKISIPWFILLFVVAMIINTYANVPISISKTVVLVAKKVLVITLFLIGAGLSVDAIKKVGFKPVLLGVILWVFIGVAGLLIVLL